MKWIKVAQHTQAPAQTVSQLNLARRLLLGDCESLVCIKNGPYKVSLLKQTVCIERKALQHRNTLKINQNDHLVKIFGRKNKIQVLQTYGALLNCWGLLDGETGETTSKSFNNCYLYVPKLSFHFPTLAGKVWE